MTELWGPLDPTAWRSVPCIFGRAAIEADVVDGRAVFYVNGDSTAASLNLPCCAYQLLEDGSELPVVVIQAELTEEGLILGIRPLSGGNGICMESEVRYLSGGFMS